MTMEEMNDMSLFEGAADNADLLEKLLKASLIHADETYQTPPQIIWVDNSTIATLGNFSASTGKAKSRKTFNVSALVAASLANGKVLQYTAKLPDDKRKILYVDTEQSRFHCHSVMQRILRLAGLPRQHEQREPCVLRTARVQSQPQTAVDRICLADTKGVWLGHH